MTRAGNWPGGLRWIARRVKPSRRQVRNLTDYEKKTGWRYSITCTNIPLTEIGGVPGSDHPQYINVVHREHACVETAGVRTAKAMGLGALQWKAWQVNAGWVIAANIAADWPPGHASSATTKTEGYGKRTKIRCATGSGTCTRGWHATRGSGHSRSAPTGMGRRLPHLLAASLRSARTHLTSTNHPLNAKGGTARRSRSGAHPGTPGLGHATSPLTKDTTLENGH